MTALVKIVPTSNCGNPDQLKCVEKMQMDTSKCITSCNGLMVTGFTKFEFEEFSRKDIKQTISDYKNYKKWFKFPAGIKGEINIKSP